MRPFGYDWALHQSTCRFHAQLETATATATATTQNYYQQKSWNEEESQT